MLIGAIICAFVTITIIAFEWGRDIHDRGYCAECEARRHHHQGSSR